MKVESFSLDHTKVRAPYARECTILTGEKGDVVAKYDIRFCQPNKEEMQSEGLHTLEHLLATYLREDMQNIIDLSPMGCRTGFYMTVWGKQDVNFIIKCVENALKKVLTAEVIPAENKIQCGNYRLHSLDDAKAYAKNALEKGFTDKFLTE